MQASLLKSIKMHKIIIVKIKDPKTPIKKERCLTNWHKQWAIKCKKPLWGPEVI